MKTHFTIACLILLSAGRATAQCAAIASSPKAAVDCASRSTPPDSTATVNPTQEYSLAELIDIAEQNNPRTRILWERAKQHAQRLGIAKSAYYPLLIGAAAVADQRFINPFPKALLPRGYSTVEVPAVQPKVSLQYLLFDFGKREGEVGAARAEELAAGAEFIQTNQEVALAVSKAYYGLLTLQERSQARRDILKTAQTTQDSAEARLRYGRATLPDVLNARAETAQAVFDLAAAEGQEQVGRVELSEALGTEPNPEIRIDTQKSTPAPDELEAPVNDLVARAVQDRPELQAQLLEIQAADEQIRIAKSAYRPSVVLSGEAAQTSIWPTADNAELGHATVTTWSASLGVQWRIFDGGARKNELASAESRKREAKDAYQALRDRAQREVWDSYIGFQTAQRQQQAAGALLDAASESYSSSLDAYQNGVKNLVDVVTAQKQLALARLSAVSARSQVFLQAVQIEFSTGSLLRNVPPATGLHKPGGSQP
jgi:outer membrane protein TolC